MRLEHSRRIDFLVTEFGLAQNLRLKLELHKLLHPLALHEHFRAFFVNRDAELVFLRKKKRVLFWRKFKTELMQQLAKLCRLFGRKQMRIRIHFRETETSNAQRSTFNAQL